MGQGAGSFLAMEGVELVSSRDGEVTAPAFDGWALHWLEDEEQPEEAGLEELGESSCGIPQGHVLSDDAPQPQMQA